MRAWRLVASASLIVAWHVRAAAAPLFVYWAPDGIGAEERAAHDVAAEEARRTGAALVDVSPPPAVAPQARALLERAIADHDGLRLDEAERALADAQREAAATGAHGLSPAELSDVLLYRGLVEIGRGDDARAWEWFVRAATVEPTRVLDPIRFPPRVVKTFQRAVAGVRAAPPASLRLLADEGCTTWIDARVAEDAQLPPGEHYVAVECPGARRAGSVLTLSGDVTRRLTATRPAPPDVGAAAALASERGAGSALLFTVDASGSAPPTLRMRLVAAPGGRVLAEATVALGPGGAGAADARDALRKLVRLAGGRPLDVTPPPPRPWYTSPWLWGAAGVVLTAAVLLPFVVDAGEPGGFDVDLGGALP